MSPRDFTESDLSAYLDGEMTGAELEEFEAWLDAEPAARAELDRLAGDGRLLRAALEPILAEPVPERLTETLRMARRPGPAAVWRRVAAAAAIFVLGSAAGWGLAHIEPPADNGEAITAERALDAHVVYVAEGRHAVEVGEDEHDHLVTWLSKRLGQPLVTPDLGAAGYRLIGGRLLPGEGAAAAAHFMYEDEAGDRLTLYIAVNPQGRETAFHLVERSGTRAFYWLDGPLGYALAGDLPEQQLLRLARAVYDQTIDHASP